jgi:type VI secretion system protein ImpF
MSTRNGKFVEERTTIRSEGDRLQPALLDRLTDDEPEKRVEAPHNAVVSKSKLKQTVLRDIGWLLNTTAYDTDNQLEDYPEARKSVLNYGIPVLSGQYYSGIEWSDMERRIRDAILWFEPRLIPETLEIRAVTSSENSGHHNLLQFEVKADLWSIPFPIELLMRSQLDLETGQVIITDQTGAKVVA